ncbi:MAG: asparagine synthase B [Bacteriovorax sp.]|jgi:asparagine synthase (glutamine-hydrolysing)
MCGFVVVQELTGSDNNFSSNSKKLIHRGPDDHQLVPYPGGQIAFHRLAIMDLSDHGRQPFKSASTNMLVCNGEIYNYLSLKEKCKNHQFISHSDCEVLLPLYEMWGIEKLVKSLDAEYALVIWDAVSKKLLAARDPMGIRPLFYGKTRDGLMAFASEVKALHEFCEKVSPFPPGHYYDGENIIPYIDLAHVEKYHQLDTSEILDGIQERLELAVKKRLQSDAEVGFLLSGGLDSSLVCAIAQNLNPNKPIRTFSIGMTDDAIDSKYAQDVASFIGASHTNVTMTTEEVLGALRDVIYHLESWDITTVRASVGMYLVCKYIKKNTNIKVLLSGEVSDELFGYKYTDFAPSPEEFQKEAQKRIRELYIYDVLRADRCISAHSLEARVPFSDSDFVQFVMSIDPALKMNTTGIGKFLLREAFKKAAILPEHILWREKAAFSDAVGHSMVDELKAFADKTYSDKDVQDASKKYPYKTPFTKESLLYRDIFESFYPNRAELIADYWMPNSSWENCKVRDPSARVLPNYGKSGA